MLTHRLRVLAIMQAVSVVTLVVVVAVLATGCAGFKDEYFANRLATTVSCDQAVVVSYWGPFGISTKIDTKDVGSMPCQQYQGGAAVGAAQSQSEADRARAAQASGK